MKFTVIGCGRWGSFIAWYIDGLGHDVTIYGIGDSVFTELRKTRKNQYLALSDKVKFETDIESVKSSDIIIISINSQSLKSICRQLKSIKLHDKTVVLCMKGLDIDSGMRLSQVAEETIEPSNKVAVWVGPGHTQAFCAGIPGCMVIDSRHPNITATLVDVLSSELIRFYYGTDIIGSELGAATKNVIGIAAGILDGMGYSPLKGPLISRGAAEISRLISTLGGKPMSAYGLCHLGDYEATLFSPYSHNRKYGEYLAQGKEFGGLAEGYYTAHALYNISQKCGIDLPICRAVYNIIYEQTPPRTALEQLFGRMKKTEFMT